ncbi:GNAT family N-acetyltransferase [Thermodesulfobacteriota bacterium]
MFEVNRVKTIEDFKKIPEIQKSAWGFTDLDTEPHHLMTRVQKYGGLVHGLYEEGDLIGFTYAVVGRWEEEHFIYSHMTAVKKEHQSKGYGFELKKAQREEVLRMGYDLMRWNFDPLESMNGYFNFHRLGVISKEYERNIYGEGESGLHKGLPTDRLIATWHLTSDRVAEKMEGKGPSIMEEIPSERLNHITEAIAYIEIPRDVRSLKETDMEQAIEWRKKTRSLFESAFRKGYVAEEIVFSMDRQRIFYKLRMTS